MLDLTLLKEYSRLFKSLKSNGEKLIVSVLIASGDRPLRQYELIELFGISRNGCRELCERLAEETKVIEAVRGHGEVCYRLVRVSADGQSESENSSLNNLKERKKERKKEEENFGNENGNPKPSRKKIKVMARDKKSCRPATQTRRGHYAELFSKRYAKQYQK